MNWLNSPISRARWLPGNPASRSSRACRGQAAAACSTQPAGTPGIRVSPCSTAARLPPRFGNRLPRTPVGKIDKKLLRERFVALQPLSQDTHHTGELTANRIRHDIAQALELPEDVLTNDAQLLDHGLDSLRLNTLAERWRAAGATVRFAELAEKTTMAAWVALLVRR